VVQYDYGKALSSGEFQRTGMLNRPPQVLLTALSKLQVNHLTEGSQVADFLAMIKQKILQQASNSARPTQEDRLFLTDYRHVDANSKICGACDPTKIVPRPSRGHNGPVIHYGLIASANQVVKDSQLRDRLSHELGVYCVEMEAAGLMDNYPCLVVRGICDYADSHKNKEWQGYASASAAAYAKELLLCTSVSHMDQTGTARKYDPLSPSTSVLAAVQSTTSLYETVKLLRDRNKTLRRLQDELEDLVNILNSLTQVINVETSMLALLQGPIDRCSQLCREFEQSMKVVSRKPKTGFRDWEKMEFMKGDISEFIDTIAGYKSTI
jgi:hypothetical protein